MENSTGKFEKSLKLFEEWREKNECIVGFCNWQIIPEGYNFMLECWNHTKYGAIIVQIWDDGNGFSVYTDSRNILNRIRGFTDEIKREL